LTQVYKLYKADGTIPEIPVDWNYEASVQRVKAFVYKWKNLTIDVAQELYVARERLSSRYYRDGANAPSWNQYCQEVGITKSTANRWLIQFYPSEEKARPQIAHGDMCAVSDLHELINAGKKFQTILADPPWAYSNQATRAATDNHYDTMSIDEICELPINRLADESAHLHLWTTNAFLFEAKRLMDAWEFEYKSAFIWTKPSMGIGNYWRVSHEYLLFGKRGDCPFLDHAEMSWFTAKRSKHSRKPHEIIKKIGKVSPGPYLELFGRETRPGWTVWGNEIERHLFNEGAFDEPAI
jgi:N6-adenosine-specific RNA methylase IME4